ncbi:hypothetical protein UFOVP199_49 [uncultured Caudovirales phage]|uniref:Uncharacterized protein n=1 Tax=uncultured Caudovirales phage TaxID=2100421 RepID=A0A6J7WQG2_9CAUD|nr:hypothetical protein UFOVP199_49 [uncultured Caudovirales phage]
MATITLDDTATIADIDEALAHLRAVPNEDRGAAWRAYTDAVLELRKKKDPTLPAFSEGTI